MNWFAKSFSDRYFETDIKVLTVAKWEGYKEDNDWTHLLRKGKRPPILLNKLLGLHWIAIDKIQSSLIDHFGVSENYKKIMEQRIRIENKWMKRFVTGDKTLEILIKAEERELELLESEPVKNDISEALFTLEKIQGVRYPAKETTMYEFFKLCNLASNNKIQSK